MVDMKQKQLRSSSNGVNIQCFASIWFNQCNKKLVQDTATKPGKKAETTCGFASVDLKASGEGKTTDDKLTLPLLLLLLLTIPRCHLLLGIHHGKSLKCISAAAIGAYWSYGKSTSRSAEFTRKISYYMLLPRPTFIRVRSMLQMPKSRDATFVSFDELPTWMTKSSALLKWDKKTSRRVRKNICSMILLSMTCREPKKKQKNGLQWSEVPQFSLHNSPRHGAWSQPEPHSPGLGPGPRRLSSCLRGTLFATLAPRCCARCHGAAELDGDVGGGSWYTYTGDTGCLEIDSMG